MRGHLAMLLVLALACGGGSVPAEQIKADLTRLLPGCVIHRWGVGEGDGDDVYIGVSYACEGWEDRTTLLYQRREDGGWTLRSWKTPEGWVDPPT